MDTQLLMLVAKAELLTQQQEVDVRKLRRVVNVCVQLIKAYAYHTIVQLSRMYRKLNKLKNKHKTQVGPSPSSRKSKKNPASRETVDCYVAPSYLSVQSRMATEAAVKDRSGSCLLNDEMCDVSSSGGTIPHRRSTPRDRSCHY